VTRRIGSSGFRLHGHTPDAVKEWKFAVDVGVPARRERPLPALSHSTAGILPVARVQAVHDAHAGDDRAEDGEGLRIVSDVVGKNCAM